jgi:anti-sigma factor RsiW
MRCDAFRELMDSYLEEALEGAERQAWRTHLRTCADCRRWAVRVEPTLLFAATEAAAVDGRKVDACADRVAALIRQQRLEQRLGRRRRPWLAAAAAVLLLVGAGVVWQQMTAPDDQVAAPAVVPAVADAQVAPTQPPQGQPPQVEVNMDGEGVRVYQFAGGSDDDTTVLFIVNPALES